MTPRLKKQQSNNNNTAQPKQTTDGAVEDVKEPAAVRKSSDCEEESSFSSKAKATTTCNLLHPLVDWSQTKTHISLQVNLVRAENVVASVEKSEGGACRLTFSATGRGVQGVHQYSFSLDLYEQVDTELTYHSIERYVLLLINKSRINQPVNWPRLTRSTEKLAWLRVDFTRYLNDCSSSEDNSSGDEQHQLDCYDKLGISKEQAKILSQSKQGKYLIDQYNLNQQQQQKQQQQQHQFANLFQNPFKMKYDYRKDTSTVDNSRNTVKHASNFKKTYLFLYNLVMFIMFLKVFLVLVIKGIGGTADDDTVKGAARIVKILTLTQLLETIHPMLGLVPGGPLMPFTQVIGRLLVNHFLTEPSVRIQSAPFAHYLFIVWSCIEIFRYTLFLPLYPMGGFCEAMVIFATIKHHEPLGTWSLTLPNTLNISFSFPLAMKIYTYLLLGPTIYYLMCYMWRQRCKQLKEKVA